MYNLENASKIESLRRQDEIAAAEKYRLIKQIATSQTPQSRWSDRLLAKLGAAMVTWGYRLQSRYDELVSTNVSANLPSDHASPC